MGAAASSDIACCTERRRARKRAETNASGPESATAIRGAALDAVQEVFRQGERDPLVVLELVIACVNARGRPARRPQGVRARIGGNVAPA